MRWSIIAVMVLGVAAAVCAAVFVGIIRVGMRGPSVATQPAKETVQVVVAAANIPAMTIVDGQALATKTVPKDDAPEGYTSSGVSVLGKVLCLPMVAGQPFTPRCFVSEGTGMHLAAALPEGKRAVTVRLTAHAGMQSVLYPGSVVDVMATFRVASTESDLREAISTVLVRGVKVLAVKDRTIVSGPAGEGESKSGKAKPGRYLLVSLLVTPQEAEALQLALTHGTLSLAMRNPLDSTADERTGTLLSDLSDKLARLIRLTAPRIRRPLLPSIGAREAATPATMPALPARAPAPTTRPAIAPNQLAARSRMPEGSTRLYEIEVYRGVKKTTTKILLPVESLDKAPDDGSD